MMKHRCTVVLLVVLCSFLVCDCSFAFSTHNSKQQSLLRNHYGFVPSPVGFLITPKHTCNTRRSFLQVASPASDLSTNKQERKRRLRKWKDSIKKYLITKPRSLFRKQEESSLLSPSQDHSNTKNIVNKMDATVDTESVLKNVSNNNVVAVETDTSVETMSKVEIMVENEIPELINVPSHDHSTTTDMMMEEEVTHERWAYSHKDVDFTGVWKIVTSDEFKKEYDLYLSRLGQPALVRSVAVNIVDFTAEDLVHDGLELTIRGKNLRGSWDRTLITSGYNKETGTVIEQAENLVHTADRLESIEAESWWEEKGTVHVSWMKGVKRYGGGDFESRRYLEDNGNILVCESIFHPDSNTNMKNKEKATIRWKFQRNK